MNEDLKIEEIISDKKLRDALIKLTKNNQSKKVNIVPVISEKIMRNATAKMGVPNDSKVLVVVDDTALNSGKAGICVTTDAIYWKVAGSKGKIEFDSVETLDADIELPNKFNLNGVKISLTYADKKEIKPFVDFLFESTGREKTPTGKHAIDLYKYLESKVESWIQIIRDSKTASKSVEKLIEAIGQIGNEKAIDGLIKIFEDSHTDGKICVKIIKTLGQIGNEKAINALQKAITAPFNDVRGIRTPFGLLEPSVSLAALNELRLLGMKMDKPLRERLDHKNPVVSEGASWALLKIKKESQKLSN